MTLGGIIYLHSIADKRMKGSSRRTLDMFHQLCGENALARVVLGTTNWGEVEEHVGAQREEQLAETFWNTITASGSKLLRFDKSQRSSRAFLNAILDQLEFDRNGEILNNIVLQIQEEVVDLQRRIHETAAGKELRLHTLEQLLEMQKEGANTEKAAPLLANTKEQIKNDPKRTKSLPVMILYFFFSPFLQLFRLTHCTRLMGEVGSGKSTVRLSLCGNTLLIAKDSSSTRWPAKLWP